MKRMLIHEEHFLSVWTTITVHKGTNVYAEVRNNTFNIVAHKMLPYVHTDAVHETAEELLLEAVQYAGLSTDNLEVGA